MHLRRQRFPFRKATKVLVGQVSLFTWCFGTYRTMAVGVSIPATLTVPAYMFTGDAYPNVIAVKAVQVLLMPEHDITDAPMTVENERARTPEQSPDTRPTTDEDAASAGVQVGQVPEQPRPPLGAASDHDAIRASRFQNLLCLAWRIDIPVCQHRD